MGAINGRDELPIQVKGEYVEKMSFLFDCRCFFGTIAKVIKRDGGVSAARNTALDAASGDYIAFLDSDDIWLPEKLDKQYSFMDKYSKNSRSPAVTKSGTIYFPLWISYAAGVLEKAGCEIKIIDAPQNVYQKKKH